MVQRDLRRRLGSLLTDGRASSSPSWVMLLVAGGVAALVAVARNGVGEYPFADYMATELAPHWPDLPGGVPPLFQFVLWSTLGPALAHALGIATTNGYLLMHAVVLTGGVAGFVVVVRRRVGHQAALIVLLVLATLPATTVVLAWSGSYDTFTLVLALLLTVCTSKRWAAVLGFVLAFSALEQGAFIVAALVLLAVGGIWGDRKVLAAAAAGLLIGAVVLFTWLRAQGVDHGRLYWIDHFGPGYFWDLTRQTWPLLVVSLFAVLWPLAIVLVRRAPEGRRWIVAAALLLPLAPTLVTEDQTRVFAMLSAPVLISVLLGQIGRDVRALRSALVVAAALAWTPGFFVWKGSPHIADWGPWTLVLR